MLHTFAQILEAMFFVGVIGSAVVVVWTFIEDIRELGPDEPRPIQDAESKRPMQRTMFANVTPANNAD